MKKAFLKALVAGDDDDPFSALFTFSGRQAYAEVCAVSGKGVAGSGLWTSGHLLSEGCEYFYRKSWHPGTDCYRGGSAVTSLEKADAVVHRRRHHLLYVVSAVGFLRKTERK